MIVKRFFFITAVAAIAVAAAFTSCQKDDNNGIGLSVSRYIMRLHGGNLLHSVSAKGMTVFSMVFG